jgi:hypothetical protein
MRSRFEGEWREFAVDTYLDARHRNWTLAEEMGDVVFTTRGVVFVHRVRAEHIVRALGAATIPAPPMPAPCVRVPATTLAACRVPRPPAPCARITVPRRRDLLGWLGIMAGAAVYVAALVLPLDDAALVMAMAAAVRGGVTILVADT